MPDIKMVDVSEKEIVYREATAVGRIKLKTETIRKILRNEIEKGDVFSATKIAVMSAVKRTSDLLPFCHPLRITHVDTEIKVLENENEIEVRVTVKACEKTGVEMEALTGVAIALLNIWDMVKKYEKDETGQYPYTKISNIYVLEKIKRDLNG